MSHYLPLVHADGAKRLKNLLMIWVWLAYDYVYVDLLEGQDKSEVMGILKQHNPKASFPTLAINNKKSIIGFKEGEIKKALGK